MVKNQTITIGTYLDKKSNDKYIYEYLRLIYNLPKSKSGMDFVNQITDRINEFNNKGYRIVEIIGNTLTSDNTINDIKCKDLKDKINSKNKRW